MITMDPNCVRYATINIANIALRNIETNERDGASRTISECASAHAVAHNCAQPACVPRSACTFHPKRTRHTHTITQARGSDKSLYIHWPHTLSGRGHCAARSARSVLPIPQRGRMPQIHHIARSDNASAKMPGALCGNCAKHNMVNRLRLLRTEHGTNMREHAFEMRPFSHDTLCRDVLGLLFTYDNRSVRRRTHGENVNVLMMVRPREGASRPGPARPAGQCCEKSFKCTFMHARS